MAKTEKLYGTGRRKKSIARVYLVPGKGDIKINKRTLDEYFGLETLKVIVKQPLVATETEGKYDILVNVHGGGYTGQAGAIRHGIARALLKVDPEFRPTLKKAGYLTRDPRMKERNTVSKQRDVLHSSQRDNLSRTKISRKAHFSRVTEVVECCQMRWNLHRMQHICNRYATKNMICIGHFQRNLGMSFLNLNLINRIY